LLITVTSDPVGQVFIDGQLMGLANQLVVNVTPGTHTLVVRRPGFLPFEQQVQGGGGDAVTIPDISLVPRAP
jgi:hypothetical protein